MMVLFVKITWLIDMECVLKFYELQRFFGSIRALAKATPKRGKKSVGQACNTPHELHPVETVKPLSLLCLSWFLILGQNGNARKNEVMKWHV
jgi:hypothetical protein